MILPVTLVFAAAAALLNFWLAMRAGSVRVRSKVLHGDGGDTRLLGRMRAHANFVEYAPFVVILCALIELARGPSFWLWIAMIVFVLARIAHAFGMDSTTPPTRLRLIGIIGTWLVMLTLAGWALAIAYQTEATRPATGPTIIGVPASRG
jgi:uncharacterized protein